jgi:hypothetical protein
MRSEVRTRWFIPAVVLALLAPAPALQAQPGAAMLSGVIRSQDQAPLAGARLVAVDPRTGDTITSEATTPDGHFELPGLHEGTWELAVAHGGGVYLVEFPLYLAGGVRRDVQIVVDPRSAVAAGDAPMAKAGTNPFLATALTVDIATLVAVLLNNVTDDEKDATPQ